MNKSQAKQCRFDPMAPQYIDAPIGMFHCPLCGEMVLAGMPHPDYSAWDLIDQNNHETQIPSNPGTSD
jgi:hypothetical protein